MTKKTKKAPYPYGEAEPSDADLVLSVVDAAADVMKSAARARLHLDRIGARSAASPERIKKAHSDIGKARKLIRGAMASIEAFGPLDTSPATTGRAGGQQ